jgi:hypothetical protein
MTEPLWQPAQTFTIPARAKHGFWTRIVDYVDGARWLKFEVKDVPVAGGQDRAPQWSYAAQQNCTADGDPTGALNPTTCLVTTAAPGALVAKVGGSCAGRADDGHVLVVGSFCLVALDATTRGTVYLGMNIDPSRPIDRTGAIDVSVSISS